MNELELYVDSLDPNLSNEEKVRLVKKWKKDNNWSQDQVEVETTKVEEVKKQGAAKQTDANASPTETPEASETLSAVENMLKKSNIQSVYGSGILPFPKGKQSFDLVGRTAEQVSGIVPIFQGVDLNPGEAKVANNYEYKYEVDENKQPVFYTKPEGQEDWINVTANREKDKGSELAVAQELGFDVGDFDKEKELKRKKIKKDFGVGDILSNAKLEPPKPYIEEVGKFLTLSEIEARQKAQKARIAIGVEDLDLDKKISNAIYEDNLDINNFYSQFKDKGYSGKYSSDLGSDIFKKVFKDDFNPEKINNFANSDDFLGFLNEKGYMQDYIDLSYGPGLTMEGAYAKEFKLGKQRKLDNYFKLYMEEANSKYTNQVLLSYIIKNKEKFKNVKSLSEAYDLAKKYFKKEYGQSTFELISYSDYNAYRQEQFPELISSEKRLQAAKKAKAQELIKEGSSEGLLQDSFTKFYDGVISRATDGAYELRELLGFDMSFARLSDTENNVKKSAEDVRYGYIEGKKAEVDGIEYIKDSNGSIYNVTSKVAFVPSTKEEFEKVNKAIDESTETGSSFSTAGSTEQFFATSGTMLFDIASIYSVGKVTKTTKLGTLTNAIRIPKASFDTMSYYTFAGYVSSKKNMYEQLIAAGVNETEARAIAEEGARVAGLWTGGTSLIAPMPSYLRQFDKILGNRSILQSAIKGYRKNGPTGFINNFKETLKNIKITKDGVIKTGIAGTREFSQEQVQQYGEYTGVNAYVNRLLGKDILKETYDRQDFVNTGIVSFAAGSAFANLNIPGFKPSAAQQLNNLYLLGKDTTQTQKLLNEMVAEDKATQEEAGKVMSGIRSVKNQMSRIPASVSAETKLESARLQQDIADLQAKKSRIDKVYHDSIDSQINAKKKELAEIVKPELEKAAARKGAKIAAEQLGSSFENFTSQESIDKRSEELKNEGFNIQESTGYGMALVNDKTGKKVILINDQVAAEDNVYTTDQHEVLHPFWEAALKANPEATITLGKALIAEIVNNKDITGGFQFMSRFQDYLTDEKYPAKNTWEEVIPLVSEALSNGDIKYNPKKEAWWKNLGTKITNFLKGNKKQPLNLEFNTGKDVFDFIRGYNETIEAGKGLTEQQLEIAKKGAKGKLIEGELDIEGLGAEFVEAFEGEMKDETAQDIAKESKRIEDSQEVQKIYDEQGVAGAMDIIQKFKPITNRIVESRSQAPNFDRQLLTDEIETGERGILDLIMSYPKYVEKQQQNKEKVAPLAGFINNMLPKRAIEASRRVLGEEFTTDVTEAKGVVAEEVAETVAEEKPIAKKPTETVEFSQAQVEKIGAKDKAEVETRITKATNEAFKGQDVKTFGQTRNVPKAVADIYAGMFGLNPQTITDKTRNYQKTDAEGLTTAKQFLLKNANNDFARLPETKDGFGKGTFLPRNVMNALYTDGKLTGTLKDYMDLIRQKPTKPIYRDAVGQTIRGLLNLHIRNRMFEDLVTTTAERAVGGAKFSKRIGESLPKISQTQIQNLGKPFSQLTASEQSTYMNGFDAFIDAIEVDDYNIEAAFNEVYGADFLTKKNGDPLSRKTAFINEWIKVRQSGKGLKDFAKQTPSEITMRDYLYQAFEEQTESEVVENILGIKKGGVDFRSKDQIMGYVNLMNNYIASKYGKLNDKEIAEFVVNELGPTLSAGAKVAGNDFMWKLNQDTGLLALVPSTLKRSNSIRTSVFGNQKQMAEVLIKPFLSKSGKNKLTYKDNTPLWQGKPLKKGQVSQKVSTYTTSIKKNGEISKELLDKSADFAQQKIETIVDFLNWYKNQGSNKEVTVDMLGMAFRAFNGDMTALVRAAARVDSFAGDGTGPQRYEHNPPARTMLVRMAEYVNGDITEQQLRDYFSNYTVSIIPELMDDVINERYKDTSPLVGSRYYNAFTYGRFPFAMTKYTKQEDGSYAKTTIGEYQKEAYENANKIKKANIGMAPKALMSKRATNQEIISDLGDLDGALNQARRPDAPVKKIRVFDFDDTLARSKSQVLYTVPNVEGGFSEGATNLKAIFMVGGPGAGKTNVGKGLQLGRRGYKVVNQDIALEAMKAESGLPAKESDYTAEQRSLRSKLGAAARKAAVAKFDKYAAAGNGMVIDGTGASYNATTKKIKALQDLGYEVHMVVATTPLETAIERNKARAERSLPDFVVKKTYESVQESLKKYREDFGDRLYEINTETIEYGKPLPNDFLQQVYAGINVNKVGKVDASNFATQYDVLESQGAEFDFREFSRVIEGKKGPLFSVAQKIAKARGTEDIFILTARPADAAKPIQEFMKVNGIDIPLKNITGLGDGTAAAKGRWIAGKAAEGYNDFYFADDAIKNVEAVKEVLSQVDVKSKVQQAKASKRKTFDKVFNNIIEQKTGIESYKDYSAAKAKTVGANKGKFTFFTTPSAEDFLGLLYKTLGKGKVGDAQMAFYKENLLDPFNRAEMAISQAKVAAGRDYKALKKQFKGVPKTLEKETGISKYSYQHAIRTYIWDAQGVEVPGLSKRDQKRLTDFIKADPELQAFADQLVNIQKGKPYPKPDKDWTAGNITTDVISGINKVNRAEYLQEWQENVDIIFSEKNMNKLEAAFGAKYVEALKDSLRSMKSGSNRPLGGDRVSNAILDWLNNSVGAIMFLNTRSAVLQTISAVNFINWGDNNILKAGKAFANQKQFWGDFLTLMNSDYLLERRDGLKINVSESEIADAVEGSKNKVNAAISYLLNKGFVFTRYADSFAIASGGATFYRNRIESLVEQGMDRKLAEQQAFEDFRLIAEENQQSSSPMRISQQQRSLIGRIILQFGNTQLQYVRIQKRAVQDLVNKRGDWRANISKIVYYGAIQNIMFNALQSGLAWALFDEDEDDEQLTEANKEQKLERALNGAIDSQLKGLGIQGAVIAGVKNALITIAEQADKKSPKFEEALDDLLSIAPALGSKIRKLKSGARTVSWNRKEIKEKGFSMDNPAYLAGAQVISAVLNIPLDRAVMKMNNMRNILNPATENWQKVALALGWSGWDVGLPYFGLAEDKPVLTETEKQVKKLFDLNKSDQVKMLLDLGLTKKEIRALTKEEQRVDEIIKLQNKNKDAGSKK